MTNSLRDKIGNILHEWSTDIMLYNLAPFSPNSPAKSIDIADRIITLLSDTMELKWEGDRLYYAGHKVGFIKCLDNYHGYAPTDINFNLSLIVEDCSESEARAEVESAVRKVLGLE